VGGVLYHVLQQEIPANIVEPVFFSTVTKKRNVSQEMTIKNDYKTLAKMVTYSNYSVK
jgi:hypothetical protein